jgi:hypothetical protein
LCRTRTQHEERKPLLTLFIALSSGISAFANPTPPAEVDSLIHDKAFVEREIQQHLDAIYKGGNTQVVDTSLFSPYSSGDHHYLIAKAYITFYNENPRQAIRGILKDVDSGWTFSISQEQLDYFVRTGDRTYLPQPPNLDPNEAAKTPTTDPGLTADPSPTHKIAVWPDGRILTHPEHFVRTCVIKVKSGDTLILRSGPGTKFESVREIPRGGTGLMHLTKIGCGMEILGGIPSNGRVLAVMWAEVSLGPPIRSRLNRSVRPYDSRDTREPDAPATRPRTVLARQRAA